jgi:hypothetical protein
VDNRPDDWTLSRIPDMESRPLAAPVSDIHIFLPMSAGERQQDPRPWVVRVRGTRQLIKIGTGRATGGGRIPELG